nr:DNA methyltransferase [Desulfuromonas sp. TF]
MGIEVNPRAAAITDMVLWIGYLQWHFRTRGNVMPPEPVIKKFCNIECRDAVLAYDRKEPLIDENGNPVTIWDGRTTKPHPVTGEQVPDEMARIALYGYVNPRKAEWPEADFVVGNPPFIGAKSMRAALGDGYTEALRREWNDVPDSSDFVMYWWHHAAGLVRQGRVRRFGFITTNSLTQVFNRNVVQNHLAAKQPLSLAFAIPDHPWVDSADGAAVRIAMTVGRLAVNVGDDEGVLTTLTAESEGGSEGVAVELATRRGTLHSDLKLGANVAGAGTLRSNADIGNRGIQTIGTGFVITPDAAQRLGFGRIPGLEAHIRPYLNGRDLTSTPRGVLVIDLFGLGVEEVRSRFPEVYQWVHERVKPERDYNARQSYRENWWLLGENQPRMRESLFGLNRFIATVLTAKHRVFSFLDVSVLPDQTLVCFASEDPYHLGVLSSRIHITWALAAGGRLGVGNDPRYNKSRCFETFPFPACEEEQKFQIRTLGETLDAHRKRQKSFYPDLTMTGIYNVLEKLRTGETLSSKEREIHEKGLVSVLKQLHDDLDAAVFAAYGWPATLSDEEILERLVTLNRERAREEEQGLVRWLRPEFQAPHGAAPGVQVEMGMEEEAAETAPKAKHPRPKNLPEQVLAIRAALAAYDRPVTAKDLAKGFERARVDKVLELLETLASLGQAGEVGEESFVA